MSLQTKCSGLDKVVIDSHRESPHDVFQQTVSTCMNKICMQYEASISTLQSENVALHRKLIQLRHSISGDCEGTEVDMDFRQVNHRSSVSFYLDGPLEPSRVEAATNLVVPPPVPHPLVVQGSTREDTPIHCQYGANHSKEKLPLPDASARSSLCTNPPCRSQSSNRMPRQSQRLSTVSSATSSRDQNSAVYSACGSVVTMNPFRSDGQGHLMFRLWKTWKPLESECDIFGNVALLPIRSPLAVVDNPFKPEGSIRRGSSRMQCVIVHPASRFRLVWDISSLALILYDILTIPFLWAFESSVGTQAFVMSLLTLVFWPVDSILSFATGYIEKGVIVLIPEQIALRYLRSWFLFDISLIFFDLLTNVIESDRTAGALQLGRSVRVVRCIRTLRLVRLLRLRHIFDTIRDSIHTESGAVYFDISMRMLSLLLVSHLVACIWYGLGTQGDGDRKWVHQTGTDDGSVSYRYATSLHWALSQLHGTMEVYPYNLTERLFAVIAILSALMMFSSTLASITSSMTYLQHMSADKARQFWMLRRFFREHGFHGVAKKRIEQYIEWAYNKQQKHVQEKDVALLCLLSEPLRDEVKLKTFRPFLLHHALFNIIQDYLNIVTRSMRTVCLARGDFIFLLSQHASHMLILTHGEARYFKGTASQAEADEDSNAGISTYVSDVLELDHITDIVGGGENVHEGSWACEAALWTPWFHMGDLHAITECQIMKIGSQHFRKAASMHRELVRTIRAYCELFVQRLNELSPEDLTDLTWKTCDPGEIVASAGLSGQIRLPSTTSARME